MTYSALSLQPTVSAQLQSILVPSYFPSPEEGSVRIAIPRDGGEPNRHQAPQRQTFRVNRY